MLRACGEAGLRRAEVAGLRWPDLNITARRLEVRRQVVQERLPDGGHRKVVTGPKAGRARRVAISATLAERLGETGTPSRSSRRAPTLRATSGPAPTASRCTTAASPGRSSAPAPGAGLVDAEGRPLVSPHRLRHSAASVMLGERVPLTVVAAQLGHADPAITARIYAHLVDDRDLDLAAGAFDRPRSTGTVGETVEEVEPGG